MDAPADTAIRAVLRCTEDASGFAWTELLLHERVGGLQLLPRHLLAFRSAGIKHATLVVPSAVLAEMQRDAVHCVPSGIDFTVEQESVPDPKFDIPSLVVEQRAATLVDPRLRLH